MTKPMQPWIGLFDLFRIGVGPSSSHTVGPMLAAAKFAAGLDPDVPIEHLRVDLFASLALTGMGHATDSAVILGLTGARPETVDPDDAALVVQEVRQLRRLTLPDGRRVPFDPARDIVFRPREAQPLHPNALRITASSAGGDDIERTYYSVGGGFVVDENGSSLATSSTAPDVEVPHPFGQRRGAVGAR